MISPDGENLVFLLSLPRSGSTILSLLLGNHSKILCPPEPWFLLKLASLKTDTSSMSRFDGNLATVGTNAFLNDKELKDSTRSFSLTAYNQKLKLHRKHIFVDKTPRYYHILPFLDELFPKAKKIWLIRNPLDVAASYKSHWGIDITSTLGNAPNCATLDFAMGLFELYSYFDEKSSYKYKMHYEEFVGRPEPELKKLCKFLHIDFQPAMFQFHDNKTLLHSHELSSLGDKDALATRSVQAAAVGKWKNVLTSEEIASLFAVTGVNIFSRLGYTGMKQLLAELKIQLPSEQDARKQRHALSQTEFDSLKELSQVSEERLKSLKEKEEEIDRLSDVAEERGKALLEKESEIHAIEREAKEQTQSLNEKETSIAEKETEIIGLRIATEERSASLLEKQAEINSMQQAVEEHSRALLEKEAEIESTKKAAEDRLQILQSLEQNDRQLKVKEKEIENLKAVADERLQVIMSMGALDTQLKEKENEINELKAIADERLHLLKSMEGTDRQLQEKEKEINDLKAVSNERLQLLESMQELAGQVKEKEEQIDALRVAVETHVRELTEKEKVIAALGKSAEKQAQTPAKKE